MKIAWDRLEKLSDRKKITLVLLIGLVVSLVFKVWDVSLTSAFVMLLLIHFFHSLFYTEPTRIFWGYIVIPFVLYPFSFLTSFPLIPVVCMSLAVIEIGRVLFMAILKYPASIQELKLLNEELERRVEERTRELREANQKLMELDEMKTAFVSQASHDLRTPLAAIKGSLDNLVLGVAGDLSDKQRRILDRASRSVDRLTDLINDILDLSRIETGRTKLEKCKIAVNTIAESVVQENKPAAEWKRITIRYQNPTEPLYVYADAGKMQRVFGELVNNAIKYTREEGTIDLLLDEAEGMIRFSVKDTGIGMNAEECKRIWERFYRTVDSQFLAKGSGLGLSIAKELVEMHDGKIRVESEKGKGSCFRVLLPKMEIKARAEKEKEVVS